MSKSTELRNSRKAGTTDHQEPENAIRAVVAAYGAKTDEELPLGAYAALVGLYSAGMIGALEAVEKRDCRALSQISTTEFALLALATHKLSRLITKDYVTSPLRGRWRSTRSPPVPERCTDAPR